MAITIFENTDFKGSSRVLSGNIPDLKGLTGDKPSSIKLTGDGDEVLLFKNDDWKGGVLYLRGPKNINDLGKKDDGGKNGFGNSIRSIRLSPFQLDLNVTVVKDGSGRLPGGWTSESQVRTAIQEIVTGANQFYNANRALLSLVVARVTFRRDDKHFTMNKRENIPNDWTERGEVDVIVVNRFTGDDGIIGRGKFPCWGQNVVIAATLNATSGADEVQDDNELTYMLVHELGHYLGLSHNSANDNTSNIMFPELQGLYELQKLRPDQIEEMQDKLAGNLARRGDRN